MLLALAIAACGRGEEKGAAGAAARAPSAAAVPAERASAPAAGPTVLFIGTSLTAGLGLDPDEAYPALIQQRIDSLGLGWRVVNAGLSGETSAGALRRVDWLLRTPADVIVVETGANDGLRGLSVDSMRANIAGILDKIKAEQPRARIFLAAMEAPPNLGPRYTAEFRSVFPELAARYGATLIPFFLDGVAEKPSLNQGDGIHPNVAGERIVAENVWRALAPSLAGGGVDAPSRGQ